MSKTQEPWIDFGIGTKQVNSRSLPAHYTPTNYTSDEVASEGTDKVSAHLKGIDTALASAGSSVSFTDEFFTGTGSQTDFVTAVDINGSSVVEVYVNGILKEITNDYTVTTATDTIAMVSAPANGARLRIRVYDSTSYSDELFGGGTATFTFGGGFDSGDKLDVFVNGIFKEETNDWTRNATLNQITLVGGAPPSSTRIRIRKWS